MEQKTSKLAIASFTISIIALVGFVYNCYQIISDWGNFASWTSVFAALTTLIVILPLSLIVIILSLVSLWIVHKKKISGKKYALASLIIGTIITIVSLLFLIWLP